MARQKPSGHVTHQSPVALLLIDVINAFDFPGAATLVEQARPMAREIAGLCREARRRRIPVIYANDNFGLWRSDLRDIVRSCRTKRGASIVRLLAPHPQDYFVVKPKNSAFYCTTLDLLLQAIGVRRLILTGLLADNCVLFSGNDAYMRDYKIVVPADCVASLDPHHRDIALEQMKRVLKADIRPWQQLSLGRASVRTRKKVKAQRPA